jgi:hypothetical protein
MLNDQKPMEELSAFAEQSREQTLGAVDTYFDLLKKTVSSLPSGGTEFGEMLKGYSEQNIAATHEFITQLSQSKDIQEMGRIQSEFMQTLLDAFREQTESPGRAFTKAAGAINAPFKSASS